MADRSGVIHPADPVVHRSASDIVQDVVRDIQEIVRAEVQLVKAEFAEKTSQVTSAGGMFGGAAVTGLLGAMALCAAVIAFLALYMPVWGAALIVSFVLLVAAAILFFGGRARARAFKPVPERTAETIKEDVEWAKHRIK